MEIIVTRKKRVGGPGKCLQSKTCPHHRPPRLVLEAQVAGREGQLVQEAQVAGRPALGIVRVERQRNKLTSLGLGRCGIGPTGAAEIAEYVSVGVLTNLKLGHNRIRDEGAKALADALRVNRVLTNLNLRNSDIGPEGGKAIGEALAAFGKLRGKRGKRFRGKRSQQGADQARRLV